MKKVLCFGEVLWDAFGDGKKAGGAPMNVARHLVQQGVPVSLASRIGSDELGKELEVFLKENGLYSELIQQDASLATCEVTVQLDDHNQATYVFPPKVSWDNIQPDANLVDSAKDALAIVFGSLACRQETTKNTLLTILNNTGALKIFDVNLRPPHYSLPTVQTLAAMADIVKMNEEEVALLVLGNNDIKEKILAFHEMYNCKTICVTRGEHGAIIWHDNTFYEHPGFKVSVADSVGAGDSFLAALIAGLLSRQPLDKVLEKGCAIGAFVASKRGANPVYDKDEIFKISMRQI